MSDNHSFSTDQQHQLAAEAVALSDGTSDQQAQAQNIAWAINEGDRNQTAGNNS